MELTTILSQPTIDCISQYTDVIKTADELENFIFTCQDSLYNEFISKLSTEATYILNKNENAYYIRSSSTFVDRSKNAP